jgi:hypothetical protein
MALEHALHVMPPIEYSAFHSARTSALSIFLPFSLTGSMLSREASNPASSMVRTTSCARCSPSMTTVALFVRSATSTERTNGRDSTAWVMAPTQALHVIPPIDSSAVKTCGSAASMEIIIWSSRSFTEISFCSMGGDRFSCVSADILGSPDSRVAMPASARHSAQFSTCVRRCPITAVSWWLVWRDGLFHDSRQRRTA